MSKMCPVKILIRFANAQADLNLRLARKSGGTFSDAAAYIEKSFIILYIASNRRYIKRNRCIFIGGGGGGEA